jgi:histidinol-phosphate aminotransferase
MGEINLQYTTIKTPLPNFIYSALRSYSAGANIYRPQPTDLIQRISSKYNIPSEMIFLTAGIDEALQMFAHAYGTHIYVFTPTYIVHGDGELFGKMLTRINCIDKKNTYSVPIKQYKDASLILIANPNNPSGFTSKENVMKLIRLNPTAMVVVDEAYGAFGNMMVDDEVKNHNNMAVLRSFSKDYGMAGNRIGYIISHPEVIQRVSVFTTWANISYLSVGAAVTALDHEEYFAGIRNDLNKRRNEFLQFLVKQRFTVLPSQINAIIIKFDTEKKANDFVQFLKDHSIVVSHGNGHSNIGLDNSYVRISIGTKEQMAEVKKVIVTFSVCFEV